MAYTCKTYSSRKYLLTTNTRLVGLRRSLSLFGPSSLPEASLSMPLEGFRITVSDVRSVRHKTSMTVPINLFFLQLLNGAPIPVTHMLLK